MMSLNLQEEYLVVGSRYVSAAGLVILLYNHLLTFNDEVKYIWNAKWSTPKLLFLVLRYGIPCIIVWHICQLSMIDVMDQSPSACRIWFITAICICIATAGPMRFFLMLRLWVLSGRNRSFVFATLGIFVLTEITSVAFAITVSIKMAPSITSVKYKFLLPDISFASSPTDLSNNRLCVLMKRDILWTPFAPGMVFEILGLVAIFLYSLRSYKKDKTQFQNIFCTDGVGEVLLIFCLTVAKFLVAFLVPLPVVFHYVIFFWCATTMLATKMILQRREHAIVQRLEFLAAEKEAYVSKGRDKPDP